MSGALADSWVIGRDGGSGSVIQNGGTVTYNPINHPETFIGASATSTATVASYHMNGGTLEMSNTRLGLAIGPITSHLNQTGGTINVRHLELGSNLATGTGIYNLTGGTLNVGNGGITSFSGLYEVNLKGGTVSATANWGSPLAMKLINTVTFDSGVNTVTLSGGLTDFDVSTAPGGLVKTGTGTLVLSGFNNYTGPTTVSAGTLAGSGNGDVSAVTVAAGASIAPGVGVGTFGSGSTVSLASNSTLKVEINSTTGLADQLAAVGTIDISNANLTITDLGSGIIAAGTELVIVESGSSRIGTFAGYTTQDTEVSVGFNKFSVHYTASQVTLISIGTPYGNWVLSNGLDGTPGFEQGFNADPDNDGTANGLEWILGGNPLAQDGSSLVTTTGSATTGLTLTFNRVEASIGNATLTVQWDDNLDGTWTDVPVTQAGGSYANGVTVGVNQTATPDAVTVVIPASNAPNGKVFARLRATMP